MTSPRIFPTDKPERQTYARKGTVRARMDTQTYLVDFFDNVGGTEAAHYPGSNLLERGALVRCVWSNEGGIWMIIGGVGATREPGEDCNGLPPLFVQASLERHDVCQFRVDTPGASIEEFVSFRTFNSYSIRVEDVEGEDDEADFNVLVDRDINLGALGGSGETGRDINIGADRNVNISSSADRVNIQGKNPLANFDLTAVAITAIEGDIFLGDNPPSVLDPEEWGTDTNGHVILGPPNGDTQLRPSGIGRAWIHPFGSGEVLIDPEEGDVNIVPILGDVNIDPAAGDVTINPAGTLSAKYTPATPGDWSGTAPTTLAEAIDRIAAVVAAAHGAIP